MAEIKTPVRHQPSKAAAAINLTFFDVLDANSMEVCCALTEETAAAIVAALNLNAELLSALRGLRDEDYQSARERLEFGPGDWEARQLVDQRHGAADAVIASAGEVING